MQAALRTQYERMGISTNGEIVHTAHKADSRPTRLLAVLWLLLLPKVQDNPFIYYRF